MRIIPRTTKIKVQFFRNISILDIIIAFAFLGLIVLLLLSNLGVARFILAFVILVVAVMLFIPFEGDKFYVFIIQSVKYIFTVKKYSQNHSQSQTNIELFMPFKNIRDGFIEYNEYYAGVLQINPREFSLLSEYRQNQMIDENFGKIIREISNKTKASIVKIDRKLSFEAYAKDEERKKDELFRLFENNELSKKELDSRVKVINDRIRTYKTLTEDSPIKKPFYYLVIYDESKEMITTILNDAVNTFQNIGMASHILDTKELAIFVKYNYTSNFEEKDVDMVSPEEFMSWIYPQSVEFKPRSTIVDGEECFTFTVKNFPISVMNAWGYKIFNIPNTKVVMNLVPFEKLKAVRMIDRSIQELASQSNNSYRASSLIDKQTHINTLVEVLRMLQNDNETLYGVNLHITVYSQHGATKDTRRSEKKNVKRIFSEEGFELVDNYFRQNLAFVSTNISRLDAMGKFQRAIHSNSVAAVFPFVLSNVMDDRGCLLGTENDYPVVVDFFKRDYERVNSNAVIIGKSGSGKSFATKTILSQLSAENAKIFILDPENEYQFLAQNLGGRLIDVGTASEGRINPFHVITTLEGDETGSDSSTNNFAVHLQFLEEFFKVSLPGISSDALEYLNNLIVELYRKKNIDSRTDFASLEAKDYPTFDDLYKIIETHLSSAKVEYDITQLRVLSNYISKFAGDGRNANLWNGESTLTVKENFTVFNFQSLLANKNNTIANAQMLMVLKWLDNEIIKNRDFNLKHNSDRKIVVAIDEAHVFIDPKYPVALDFMYQLAKRIRKYNGMQIVITQNIKDFVGSEEIVRKSTAIINACQYSFIFALSPNDMDDLCTLYDKAGQINEVEQDQIVNNLRGNAFIITSPTNRTNISVIASKEVRAMFTEPRDYAQNR
ncbi:MAG: ATP-binding protein [Bacilli bacterium]|nr:ATP-binding protein [Bacilli bacterium]